MRIVYTNNLINWLQSIKILNVVKYKMTFKNKYSVLQNIYFNLFSTMQKLIVLIQVNHQSEFAEYLFMV